MNYQKDDFQRNVFSMHAIVFMMVLLILPLPTVYGDDHGDGFSQATPLTFHYNDAEGKYQAVVNGTIDTDGDNDYF